MSVLTVRSSTVSMLAVNMVYHYYYDGELFSSVLSVRSESGLAEDLVVRVEREGGGERSDVADERSFLERRRGGRQEGQLAHFTVGR